MNYRFVFSLFDLRKNILYHIKLFRATNFPLCFTKVTDKPTRLGATIFLNLMYIFQCYSTVK